MSNPFKNISVIGAGAVGCFFGGMLARAGHHVTLIGRQNHVWAIEKFGLEMVCQNFHEFVKIKASTDLDSISNADLVLFCVKSPDTDETARQIAPLLKKNTVILSLQNGIDNCDRLRKIIPNPSYPAVVYVASAMGESGQIRHFGRGELVIGDMVETSDIDSNIQSHLHLKNIAELFAASHVPCKISGDIKKALWSKFLVNCIYNGISAITQMSYGDLVQSPEINSLIDQLTSEFLCIAAQENVSITLDEATQMNQMIAKTMSAQKSSTAQDLQRGKSTEIDFLNGLIVKKGLEYNIPTPNHQTIWQLIKGLELTSSPP